MKSLYGRQFLLTARVTLISFALPETAFTGLFYQYTTWEPWGSMERNADYMADFTAKVWAERVDIRDMTYQLYVADVAHIANTFVLVTKVDEKLVLCSDGTTIRSGLRENYLPQPIISQFQKEGGYSGMTILGDLFSEKRFMAGTPITVKTVNLATRQTEQVIVGMAYVTVETSDITELWQTFISIFSFTAVVVLCVAFTTNSITPLQLTNPLKEIVEAVRKFDHGEYEVRVQGYEKRKDEVGELTGAFNVMTDSIVRSKARHSEFMTNISHELKVPMTTIADFSDGILGGTILPDKKHAALQTTSSETRQLPCLVRQILDLSCLQSARDVTTQEQFSVSEVILRALVSLESKINARHLDVDTQLPDGPVLVQGDPDATTQTCYNLLDNTIRFSTEGSTMGLSITAKEGKVCVAARNRGNTIPPDELATIFDRFYKSDKSRFVDREGMDLRLYIIRAVLNNHKGNVSVTSQDGVTEFVFTLALA